ncbi:alginate export family protein [Thalassolituus sp. ST750PaO-4]|uniref:alginate export family protein n=1 Tax=Thalassolituus sp. ST750PaO-4 TaxID=2742965 RepID=UPI001CE38E1C|nr:alginate export family protein [Thalassolituus sp. ST750PaO-4]MCA6058669.1 alginate export family protein [Thalassolituus sp. ST750PaO-4]
MIFKLSSLASALLLASPVVLSQSIDGVPGNFPADFRLRYETNDTDNLTKSATALTLRSRIGYETDNYSGLKALAEIEDVRSIIDDYAPESSGYDPVADPVNTEINRAQLSYTKEALTAVVGRQRIILDNARFIGNVGWRQNEQTYDAALLQYKKDGLGVTYAYINQVNDINFSERDITGHALNLAFDKLSAGKLVTYAYLVDIDDSDLYYDTYGVSLAGQKSLDDIKVNYLAEIATQSAYKNGDKDAIYYHVEAGATLQGVNLTLGNETLGSDDGEYGFQTPLATKHAFNGWADGFLLTKDDGLSDSYVRVSGNVNGIKALVAYHEYSTDKGGDDLGSELNLQLLYSFNKNISSGLKYAGYDASGNNSDIDKFWLWCGLSF